MWPPHVRFPVPIRLSVRLTKRSIREEFLRRQARAPQPIAFVAVAFRGRAQRICPGRRWVGRIERTALDKIARSGPAPTWTALSPSSATLTSSIAYALWLFTMCAHKTTFLCHENRPSSSLVTISRGSRPNLCLQRLDGSTRHHLRPLGFSQIEWAPGRIHAVHPLHYKRDIVVSPTTTLTPPLGPSLSTSSSFPFIIRFTFPLHMSSHATPGSGRYLPPGDIGVRHVSYASDPSATPRSEVDSTGHGLDDGLPPADSILFYGPVTV
jgi:hypothetical protein